MHPRGRAPARRTLTATIAVTAVAVAGCAGSPGGSGDSGGSVSISVGVDPAYAPMFVADKEGLFGKHGVHVNLVQTDGGPAPAQNVVAGTSQFAGNADSTALSVMATSPGLRALGVYEESGRYLKVVLRNGIRSAHQIKKMGTIPGLGLYATVKYLESKGISRDSVQLVQAGAPEMPTLLGKGSIDGYVLYEPWATDGKSNGGHIVETTGDYGVKYHMWLIADEKWLSGHQKQAGAVFAALAEADKIVASDPKRACEATQQEIKMPTDKCLGIVSQIDFAARGFTSAGTKSSTSIVDFFLAEKLMKSRPDLSKVILPDWYRQHVSGGSTPSASTSR